MSALIAGHKTFRRRADEVAPSRCFQRFQHDLPVLGKKVLQQSSLHRLFLRSLGHIYLFHGIRVKLRIEHGGGDSSGSGIEVLHLLGAYFVLFQEESEIDCLIESASRVGGHKVWNEILFLSHALGYFIEALLKALVGFDMGLAHLVQYHGGAVLGSYLQLPAYVVHYELLHKLVVLVLDKVIVPYAGAYEYFFYSLDPAYLPQQGKILGVIDFQGGAGRWSKTFLAHAQSLCQLLVAGGTAEVRSGTAYVMYVALEIRHFRDTLRLCENGLHAPYSHSSALMKSY